MSRKLAEFSSLLTDKLNDGPWNGGRGSGGQANGGQWGGDQNIDLLRGRSRDDGLRPVMSLMTGVLRRKSAEECPGPQEQFGGGCLTSVRAC